MKKNVDPIEHYGTKITEAISLAALLGGSVAAILYGKKLYDAIKAVRKKFDNDPEIEAAADDMLKQAERLKDTAERKVSERDKRHTKK
jgi:hypothetical protein